MLIPSGNPPHREMEDDPGNEHRFEMCRLVADADDGLEVSRLELDRDAVSYTYETLVELSKDGDDDLVLILGGDQAATFPEWHRPEEILGLAELAVTVREGYGRNEILSSLDVVKGAEGIRFFDMPRIELSSAAIRERVREGHPIRYLVPDSVATYIGKNGLYVG